MCTEVDRVTYCGCRTCRSDSGSPLFSMECQGSKRACPATLRLWRLFGVAVGWLQDSLGIASG